MTNPVYKIRRIYKNGPSGITAPKFCTMNAILKSDNDTVALHCVYNEKTASNLAQTLHIPNADGVLTDAVGKLAYASLEIANPKIPLPNLRPSWFKMAAEKYPEQASALVAFDILIGNADRCGNLKASLFTPSENIFVAFDHSHALYYPWATQIDSIAALKSVELIVEEHPFYGCISRDTLWRWCKRIADTPDYLIKECCEFGKPINTVDMRSQEKMAWALIYRKNHLLEIIKRNEYIIRWK